MNSHIKTAKQDGVAEGLLAVCLGLIWSLNGLMNHSVASIGLLNTEIFSVPLSKNGSEFKQPAAGSNRWERCAKIFDGGTD